MKQKLRRKGIEEIEMGNELKMFECEKHYDSLVKFIRNVDVSESAYKISIQGDWGLGKTKAMEYIIGKLKADQENISIIEENGWQLSNELHKGSDVSYFVSHLIINDLLKDVSGEKKEKNLITEAVEKGKSITSLFKGVNLGPISIDSGNVDSIFESIYKILDNQKANLETIRKFSTENAKHRFVIFIDDLDRLKPEVAVEILEQIHTNLNLKGCVFVIAIDFDVVKRGVQAKYGDDFGKDKAMQFFEKIIQLPYDLPNMQYDLLEYIGTKLDGYDDPSQSEEYKIITEHIAVDRNPRRINRAFDLAKLYEEILRDKASDISGWKKWTYLIFLFKVYYPECFESLKKIGEDYSQKTYKVLSERLESKEESYKEADNIEMGYIRLNSYFGIRSCTALENFSKVVDILFESTEEKRENMDLYGKLFDMFHSLGTLDAFSIKEIKKTGEIRSELVLKGNGLSENIEEVTLYSENKDRYCSLKVKPKSGKLENITNVLKGNDMFYTGEQEKHTAEKAPEKIVYTTPKNTVRFSRINLYFEQENNRDKLIKFLKDYIFKLDENDVERIIKRSLGGEYICAN